MEILISVAAVVLSCALVIICIPAIVRVVKAKNLFDEPDDRKVHKTVVPTMGGIAIFIGITISTLLLSTGLPILNEKLVFAAMILLLFIGIKDDIMLISPRSKFIIQLLAAITIVVIGDFRITNLHGILGVTEISYIASVALSLLIVLMFINAYNLIDGIDGLAAGLGILGSSFFGIWFLLNGYTFLAILAFSLVGSLLGFLRYNLFGKRYKIFMGDTGSLIIGLLMVVQVFEFVEFNMDGSLPFNVESSPSLALAFVIVPITDTLRVFTLRLFKGMSPFFPDKNHIHHCLLRIYNRHYKVTLVLLLANVVIVALTALLCMNLTGFYSLFFVVLALGILGSILPAAIIENRRKKHGKFWFRLKHNSYQQY
ncbi:MAG: MraY family glycosyltransferase [Bacteroidales bacterium]|jgi:UDP-N-acetylmuramyl pentapeptide phosphotransferase/UDP-N-acetylglucosamine-1-phosphate transferase|nr:MraY family glycosyltransferase [Bacteroidales bacterium]